MTTTSNTPHHSAWPLGREYQIALDLWSRTEHVRRRRSGVLFALSKAIEAMEAASGRPARELLTAPAGPCATLAEQFNLGAVIDFSDAAGIWEKVARQGVVTDVRTTPHDQLLFNGKTPAASGYFDGIQALATRNAPLLASRLAEQGMHFERVLDVGAGAGDYAAALIDHGLADSVICVDTPYVVGRAMRQERPSLRWLPGDIRHGAPSAEAPFDAAWISNVLHHYSLSVAQRLLRLAAGCLREGGRLMIHEYLVDGAGTEALAAAMLGLHFALTTGGGRCYTTREIIRLSRDTGFDLLDCKISLPISTVLVLRQSSPATPSKPAA